MDLAECFKILQKRMNKPCECHGIDVKEILNEDNGINEIAKEIKEGDKDYFANFNAIQIERIEIYKRLENAFVEVLRTQDFASYRGKCELITSDFKKISKQLKELENDFNTNLSIKSILANIQREEREKLAMTMKLQALRQKQNIFLTLNEGIDYTDEIDMINHSLVHVVKRISSLIEDMKSEMFD